MSHEKPSIPDDADFRYVPVPTVHVPAVLRLVADLMSGHNEIPQTISRFTESEDPDPWTDKEVVDCANRPTNTARYFRQIMNALLDADGAWLTIDDLTAATRLDRAVVKIFPTQIYRYTHAHTSHEHPPFNAKWGADLIPKREQVVWYRANAMQGDQWRRVAPQLNN